MISRPGKTNVGQDDVPDVSGDDYPDDDDSSDDGDSTPLEFDDGPWEAFLPDDDQSDRFPEPGDFWIESDQPNSYCCQLGDLGVLGVFLVFSENFAIVLGDLARSFPRGLCSGYNAVALHTCLAVVCFWKVV